MCAVNVLHAPLTWSYLIFRGTHWGFCPLYRCRNWGTSHIDGKGQSQDWNPDVTHTKAHLIQPTYFTDPATSPGGNLSFQRADSWRVAYKTRIQASICYLYCHEPSLKTWATQLLILFHFYFSIEQPGSETCKQYPLALLPVMCRAITFLMDSVGVLPCLHSS